MGSSVTISVSAPVVPTPGIFKQKWVEVQSNDPKSDKELWELKKFEPRKQKGKTLSS